MLLTRDINSNKKEKRKKYFLFIYKMKNIPDIKRNIKNKDNLIIIHFKPFTPLIFSSFTNFYLCVFM